MKRALLILGFVGAISASAGCKPNLGTPQSLIIGPTILAVRGTPPEVAGGGIVTYDALTVDLTGTVAAPAVGWAQCLAINPPANGNDVSDACFTTPDDTTAPAPTFTAALAANACTIFGPETPPPMKGQPPMRPADPDTTGGYYQPVRATWQSDAGSLLAFGFERITCPLSNAPTDVQGQFASTYVPNHNPALADLTLDPAGVATPLYAAAQASPPQPATIALSQTVTLQADFTADSAETFPVWNVLTLTLDIQRESLRVSWFATGGSFEHDVTGRSETDPETFTQNVWHAPETPGPVYLWTVLRDDRGGIDFAAAEIDVTP